MIFYLKIIEYFVVIFSTSLIFYIKWTYNYFGRKNIPFLQPKVPFGNVTDSLKGRENIGETLKKLYREMKRRKWKYGGIFFWTTPNILITDLGILENIMVKDFHFFSDRSSYVNEKTDPLSAHLANLSGESWKSMRTCLNPVFTPSKIRNIFQSLTECQSLLIDLTENVPLDIRKVFTNFVSAVLASCIFGLEHNHEEIQKYGHKAMRTSKFTRLKTSFASNFPKIATLLQLYVTDAEVSEFFLELVSNNVRFRQKNNMRKKDILQMLIDLNLTFNQIAAQCFIFFLGGLESSSTLMAFAMYELAKNPKIQNQVRDEIESVLKKYDNRLCYDAVQDMKYMQQVLEETLRLYPPVPITNRKCQRTYKIPGHSVTIEKGTIVRIPVLGIHHDEQYYPEPLNFDPNRFSSSQQLLRPKYSFLAFGEGPRMCIGLRLGLMEAKVALSVLLQRYRFTVDKKTEEPIKFKPTSLILGAVGEIWLSVTKV